MNDVALAQMAGAEGPSAFGPGLMMVAIFAIFYFLVIRPQQKREKEKDDFRAALKRGDEVLVGNKNHIFLFEAGGMSALGGIHSHQLPNQPDGSLRIEALSSTACGHSAVRSANRCSIIELGPQP